MNNLKLAIFCCIALLGLAYKSSKVVKHQTGFQNIQNLQELEQNEAFSFSIISDNHGASPMDNINMARMNKWVLENNDAFVLGVGDHLEKNKTDDFLSYICQNEWWKTNFYPTIADAENDFFGSGQSDWGAGGKFLNYIGLDKRENVQMNGNGVEYYAQIKVEEITVHYIVLHFPDNPYDQSIAFPESSKQFLINTLLNINKSANDIIIVSAHSMYGSWIDNLNATQQKIVNSKCDLLLAGTTHYFERRTLDGLENSGPLMISAGSVNKARWGCNNGFVQVHVMRNPFAMIVQYVNTDDYENKLQDTPHSYIKYINSGVYPLSFPQYDDLQMVAQAN